MDNQILIPLDGSESTEEVLYYTHTIASCRPNTALTLLHVISDEGDSAAKVNLHLKTLSDLLSAEGWPVDTQVRSGDPVAAITATADEISAALIVMSTHGRSGLSRWWFGSVAEEVLRVCDRPLLIVRPGGK